MIADLDRFVAEEAPFWKELEGILNRIESDIAWRMDMAGVRRFHYLYQRASSDLARMGSFAADPELRFYLESLVARSFSEIHESRGRTAGFAPFTWFFRTFPSTFRRHFRAFALALAMTLLGGASVRRPCIWIGPTRRYCFPSSICWAIRRNGSPERSGELTVTWPPGN